MARNYPHMIWSNYWVDFADWKDDLEAEYPDLDEDDLYQKMLEINETYLDDERCNLSVQLEDAILVIAHLGTWRGRLWGYKEIRSGNIADCLYGDCDYHTWWVDDLGDFRCEAVHHDGFNYYTYRVWKEGVTQTQKDNLLAKIYDGKFTRQDITRLTRRLGDDIAAVYGWKIRGQRKSA